MFNAMRRNALQSEIVLAFARRNFSTSNATKTFVWGHGNEGQLGFPNIEKSGIRNAYEELSPRELPGTWKSLAMGPHHTLGLCPLGDVYAWGSSQYGKLGLPEKETSADDGIVAEPTKVPSFPEKVSYVACGDHQSLAIGKSGKVYSWGWGGSFFSGISGLGHGNTDTQTEPKLIETLAEELTGVKMVKVQCGELHSIGLTDDGEVWAWGNGEYGRMGNGDSSSCDVPEPVEFFADTNCIDVAAGQGFSLVVTSEGKLYGWGKNDFGQLGLGGGLAMDVYSMENFPRQVEGLDNVTKVAAGHNHAAAITSEGKLFVWGAKDWLSPNEMTSLRDEKIIDVKCGNKFTAVLSDSGKLFTFGKGGSSALGHGDRSTQKQPMVVEGLADYNVLSFTCGDRSMGAIATSRFAADVDMSFRK